MSLDQPKRLTNPLAFDISEIDFFRELKHMFEFYAQGCHKFRSWMGLYYKENNIELSDVGSSGLWENIPFIPAAAFKVENLITVPSENILKTITSSGTSTGVPSRALLDKYTATIMSQRLLQDTQRRIGAYRRPMLIVDDKDLFTDRRRFDARGAASASLLRFGQPIRFLLKGGDVCPDAISYLKSLSGKNMLISGTTINVWKHLMPLLHGADFDLSNAYLIHGGGWKLMEAEGVDNKEFKLRLAKVSGLRNSINFFGMTEQLGGISYECDLGRFHVPACNFYVARDLATGKLVPDGEEGVLHAMSLLPWSYPGGSILTDDIVVMHPRNSCRCGSSLPTFEYRGRLRRAALRGCGASVND